MLTITVTKKDEEIVNEKCHADKLNLLLTCNVAFLPVLFLEENFWRRSKVDNLLALAEKAGKKKQEIAEIKLKFNFC